MSCFIIHINLACTENFMLFVVVVVVIFHKKENHKPIKSSFSFKSSTETTVRFGTLEIFPLISAVLSMDNSQNKPKQTTSQDFFILIIHVWSFSAALLVNHVSALIFWDIG